MRRNERQEFSTGARAGRGVTQRPENRCTHPTGTRRVPRGVFSAPENESEKVEQLFQAFLQAKEKAGEEIAKLTPAGFKEFVRKKTEDLQEKQNCRTVEYVVETVNGQVKLKALVKELAAFQQTPLGAVPKISTSWLFWFYPSHSRGLV